MSVNWNIHQRSSSSGNGQKLLDAAHTFTWLTLPEGPSRIWDKCPMMSKQELLIAYVTSLKVCLQKAYCMWDKSASVSMPIKAGQPSHAVQTCFALLHIVNSLLFQLTSCLSGEWPQVKVCSSCLLCSFYLAARFTYIFVTL